MAIRDRIKELRRVKACELLANPKNFRTHSQEQRGALQGVLDDVGIADAVLAYETPAGLQLVDGHLRADIDPNLEWPVLVLDVTESEADLILATHDPIAAMAGTNAKQLEELLGTIQTSSEDLANMLTKLAEDNGILDALGGSEPVEIIEDEVPEPPEEPVTKTGDLWLLGVYWECDTCGKKYEHAEGIAMKERCPCG